ncbi:hypothetical protein KBZ10_06145 [Streptomyces sp. F63]|uniref:hypothetical protein n=1 Tax=Streptomyces sp. F63 TaxID=2824887 RepID=UPI001B389CA3|nr:hypothetical protein [Streptomyces sp. F63]MBQ0984111.1 hypothetical protein [Streptomyces sp. F63]
MFLLDAALALLGVLMGSLAHLPAPVGLAAALVIAVWLLVFAARERDRRHRARQPEGV